MWHSELTTALATGCQPAAIVQCGLNYARCVVVQTTTVYDLTHVVGTVWYAILKFPVFQQIVVNYILLPCISIVTFIAYRHTLPASVDTQIGHVTTTYTALCPGSKAPQQWDVNIALAERPTCSSINYTSNIYTYSPLFSQMHVVSYLVLLLLFFGGQVRSFYYSWNFSCEKKIPALLVFTISMFAPGAGEPGNKATSDSCLQTHYAVFTKTANNMHPTDQVEWTAPFTPFVATGHRGSSSAPWRLSTDHETERHQC